MGQLILSIAKLSKIDGREGFDALIFNPPRLHQNKTQYEKFYTKYSSNTSHFVLNSSESPLLCTFNLIEGKLGKLNFAISGISSSLFIYKNKLDEFIKKVR